MPGMSDSGSSDEDIGDCRIETHTINVNLLKDICLSVKPDSKGKNTIAAKSAWAEVQ